MAKSDLYSTLDEKTRRALIRRASVRPALTALTLTALYFVVPMGRIEDLGTVVLLVSVLVAVVSVCVWQVVKVVKSEYPAVQAMEALAAIVAAYLIGFSVVYFLIAQSLPQNFSEPVSRMGSLYFTLSVFSTAGFGDIAAKTDFARAIVSLQIVGNLMIIALGGRLLVAAVKRGQSRKKSK